MKHLRIFASMEEYEAAKPSMDTPFVVLTDSKVVYSNLVEINEDDLDTTEYIDLGLPSGLKWASCNIGADKPCDYGLLFQWGRVDGYAYGDTNHQFAVSDSTPATTSGKTYAAGEVLDPEDDAAYVATNGAMRMPTKDEINELLAGTTNEWCQCTVLGDDHTTHNVYGRLFTSKTNGNKIFIPAAGFFDGYDDSFYNAGSNGHIWSASIQVNKYSYTGNRAGYLFFGSDDCYCGSFEFSVGYSVRGVCK